MIVDATTMRSILKAAHEEFSYIPRWNGPFYVIPHYDCFILRGFGSNSRCPHFLVRSAFSEIFGAYFTFEAMP